jgi:hypothetical protein
MIGSRQGRAAEPVLDVGTRRELFVDDYLIEELSGEAERRLQHPTPQEIALVHDAPWEGSGSGYHSIFQDGARYRMYYKAWHLDVSTGKLKLPHPLFTCYAESDDGIRWRKPELGLVEFAGSTKNNIVLASGKLGNVLVDAGHPAVSKDDNPDCPPEARYKAIVRSAGPRGLLALRSADGIHFVPMQEAPIITQGAFDSQNLAFWDPAHGIYRAYWRTFTGGVPGRGVRAIRGATSKDFVHWSAPFDLDYSGAPLEHLYTNQIKPYHRAPHLLLGFPTRYVERGWSDAMRRLPERGHRELRSAAEARFGTALTEGLFMSSRDGRTFRRWPEAFLRPGIERAGTWHYGHQYIAWHVVETRSGLDDAPNELSLYSSESYWTGNSSALRRYTLRLDGFVAVAAPMSGGVLRTRPLRFRGSELVLNFSTSAAGSIQVELQDLAGKPIPGRTLDDCPPLFGDAIDAPVTWKGGDDLAALAGQPVRLRIRLRDADLFALQFRESHRG